MRKRGERPAPPRNEDNPAWTREEVRTARPALSVVAEVFGPEIAEGLRRGRGRPSKPVKKVNQTLRLDPDVLEAFRAEGTGWQARINQVLREHMPRRGK